MENKFGVIYKITNLVNGKVYIGQTKQKDPYKRVSAHYKKGKSKDLVFDSVIKYGKHNFSHEILCSSTSKEYLNYLEIYFIKLYDSLAPKGMNIKEGGHFNGPVSKNLREHLSKMRKGKPATGRGAKGHKKSLDHRLKMSISRKGFTSENRRRSAALRKYKTGIKILAKNIESGLEMCFYSEAEASTFLQLNQRNINAVVYKKQNRTQHKGWRFEKINTSQKEKNY